MKKFLTCTLVCLLFCAMTTGALANGWGLLGGIYDIVSEDDTYEAYTASADDGNKQVKGLHVNHAILTSRYHSQLIMAYRHGKTWEPMEISTTAVYQPDDPRSEDVSLVHTENGFSLIYGSEQYDFIYRDGEYFLRSAFFDTDSLYGDSLVWSEENYEGYLYWQGGNERGQDGRAIGDALWQVGQISMMDFNIELLPRSLRDVLRMNMVHEQLMLSQAEERPLGTVGLWTGEKKGVKLAVYSAPDKDSYRASNGKASVSTAGEINLLGSYGDEWTMIEYEVSNRTSRIGFVNATLWDDLWALPLADDEASGVALRTARDTYITDDPNVSQYAQVLVPAGTEIRGLADAGDFYAYVAYEQGGQLIWGFMPLRDLEPVADNTFPHPDRVRTYDEFRWDVMETMIGKWDYQDGAELVEARLVLMGFGSCRLYTYQAGYRMTKECSWRVIDREPGMIYPSPDAPLYELLIVDEANEVMRFGIVEYADGTLTFMSEDASGQYVRTEYSTYGNG